ncbi:quinone oxidoreductase family protein [Nocardioides bigeumensis]|uniref:Zinc-binding dehydrogenase n=1 Tax=Nocardioides bigeumensis TaxID=433657 RepID=A0ABN2XPJ8_9ACTN
MRASLVTAPGTPEPVRVASVADPSPQPHWVNVRLHHAALNRLDVVQLAARTPDDTGAIFGSDGAGTVEALGSGLSPGPAMSPGDEVVILPSLFWGPSPAAPGPSYEILGSPTNGTHAEIVCVPAANLYPKPRHLSWPEAAALPMATLTAWRALVTRGRLAEHECVVVGAASSGVGSAAIQIAVAHGARVVAVTSSEERAAHALKLGASVAIDRRHREFPEQLRRATDGADLALDPTGALWQAFVDVLRPGGRLVVVGKVGAAQAQLGVQSVYWKQVDVLGSTMGSPRDFAALITHLSTHQWAPSLDSVFPLSAVQDAYARLDSPLRAGKVVLDVREHS